MDASGCLALPVRPAGSSVFDTTSPPQTRGLHPDPAGTHLAPSHVPSARDPATGTSSSDGAREGAHPAGASPLPCLPPGAQGHSPPGEEDVSLIFEVEAQEGRVISLGALVLVTVTARRARQWSGGAGLPSALLSGLVRMALCSRRALGQTDRAHPGSSGAAARGPEVCAGRGQAKRGRGTAGE